MNEKGDRTNIRNITCRVVQMDPVTKSEKPEQLKETGSEMALGWLQKTIDQHGLENIVDHSTILPQCIRAYKNNIAGFGVAVRYIDDYETESIEMKAEYERMVRVLELLSFDKDTKEVFEDVIESREVYGIAYLEVIRDFAGDVAGIDFIRDTCTIEMTMELEPCVDITILHRGEKITRQKKFRKYRQIKGAKRVYFKEFGDPRAMNKETGDYILGNEQLNSTLQANELLVFRLGTGAYGKVRWIGQTLSLDGSRRAEVLNNSYFTNGRHTPLLIMVRGGALSEESMASLKNYMNGIRGEAGQHAFLVLDVEGDTEGASFTDQRQPEVEVKDLASILQKDELFQEYQDNTRRKVQSAFQLPDLYVAYTSDYNRATAQTAMEVTEKQVFQPERVSIAWQVNHKLLNGFGFKYCEAYFKAPDLSNPDDIAKTLNVAERAGGVPPNLAKELAYKALGKTAEDYADEWGNIPLQYVRVSQPAAVKEPPLGTDSGTMEQLEGMIAKAAANKDDSVVAVMREVRRILKSHGEGGGYV